MKHYFNTNKVLSVTALAIGAITIFFACKKEDKEMDETRDVQTMSAAQKEAEINAIYEDAFEVTLEYSTRDEVLSGRKAPGVPEQSRFCETSELSYSPLGLENWPKTVTIDFKTGCTDEFNRTRKGKIIVELNKFVFMQGAVATITFDNYYVNDVKVEGTQTLQNLSSTAEGFSYSYTVAGGKLTFGDTAVVNYAGTRTLTQKEGASTPLVLADDLYELSGNATVSDSSFTATVVTTQKLQRQLSCPYIGKGVLTVTVNGLAAIIDYGNGDCDNKATLTLGDKSKIITLPR